MLCLIIAVWKTGMSLVPLRLELVPFLDPYLPHNDTQDSNPFVTLTYAQSLDSRISRGRGLRTTISHMETKTLTHYLRYHHDGIMVGVGTVLADNPGLNCKWSPDNGIQNLEKFPKPIIIDPHRRWRFRGSKMEELFNLGEGKAPIVVVESMPVMSDSENGVTYVCMNINAVSKKFDWSVLMTRLKIDFGLNSLMVEGGAMVINELLSRADLVDSVIVTIGATYLGKQGVEVSPPAGEVTLKDVDWWKGTRDAVMCGRLEEC